MDFVEKLLSGLRLAVNRIRSDEIKKKVLQTIPFWFASALTGLVAVLYSKLFLLAEGIAIRVFNLNHWLLLLLMPACFIFSWWLVRRFAPYANGSGIPQVMAAIELSAPKTAPLVDKLLGFRIILVKIVSSLVMAVGGAAVGREGPTIQIASSIFRIVNERLPVWIPKIAKRNMLVTGAAAGLAAAFNTPLGGIVFAIEELAKTHFNYYKTALFSSVIIAGLTAQGLLGPYLYLGYPKIQGTTPWIIFVVILVALLTGLTGCMTSKLMLAILGWKRKWKFTYQHILYLIVCGLIIAAIACIAGPEILGSGKEIMHNTLFTSDKYSAGYVPFIRIAGTVLSYTTGAAGGVFAPALGTGAAIGSVVSGWFNLSDVNTNLVILAGMVGFLTGTTRSPFTSAILVLEMTDRHTVIFYLILAGMIANLITLLVDKHSFYDRLKHQCLRDLLVEDHADSKEAPRVPSQ